MTKTRLDAGPELRAAAGNTIRAAALVAIALVPARPVLEWLTIEGSEEAARVVRYVRLGAGALASWYGIAALYRFARWTTARRHDRMARDPQRATLVPPRAGHDALLRRPSEESAQGARRAFWIGVGLLILIVPLLGAVGVLDASDDSTPSNVAMVMIGIFVALWVGVIRLRRWRTVRRVKRLSGDELDPGDRGAPDIAADRSQTVPPLNVVNTTGLAIRPLQSPVSAIANTFGRPPWRIVYLRLFENEWRVAQFLRGPWRECGYVHLLRGAGAVSPIELRVANGQRLFIDSADRLRDQLASEPVDPLPPRRRKIGGIVSGLLKVHDRLGSYPVRALLCRGAFWKSAVDELLERADVVILDLSGFTSGNEGTGWELQRVIDRFPIDQATFLADADSDVEFLRAQIMHAWSQMAAGSPNAGDEPCTIHVAVTGGSAEGTARDLVALAGWIEQRRSGPLTLHPRRR